MTDQPTPALLDATNLPHGQITMSSTAIQAVQITQPPIIAVMGPNNRPLVTVHTDGRLEYGDGYEPDEAARRFWDAVEQMARTIQYGAPLNATINEHLADGQKAEQALEQVAAEVRMLCNCCATNRPHLRRIHTLLGLPTNAFDDLTEGDDS